MMRAIWELKMTHQCKMQRGFFFSIHKAVCRLSQDNLISRHWWQGIKVISTIINKTILKR